MLNNSVTLGHAVSGTVNAIKGDKAGNQNGKELQFRQWYKSGETGWTHVIRCKTKKKREMIADCMEKAVRNQHIGYDQNERTTLYAEAIKYGYDVSKITKDVETDCSALVAVCCNYAGIPISKDVYTGNLLQALKNTGMFNCHTSKSYINDFKKLKRGDILLRAPGHVAVACNTLWWLKSTLKQSNATVDRVKDVKALQCRLNELGNYGLVVDGKWGAKTQKAVVDFQFNNQLEADGIVGKATASVLGFLYG